MLETESDSVNWVRGETRRPSFNHELTSASELGLRQLNEQPTTDPPEISSQFNMRELLFLVFGVCFVLAIFTCLVRLEFADHLPNGFVHLESDWGDRCIVNRDRVEVLPFHAEVFEVLQYRYVAGRVTKSAEYGRHLPGGEFFLLDTSNEKVEYFKTRNELNAHVNELTTR